MKVRKTQNKKCCSKRTSVCKAYNLCLAFQKNYHSRRNKAMEKLLEWFVHLPVKSFSYYDQDYARYLLMLTCKIPKSYMEFPFPSCCLQTGSSSPAQWDLYKAHSPQGTCNWKTWNNLSCSLPHYTVLMEVTTKTTSLPCPFLRQLLLAQSLRTLLVMRDAAFAQRARTTCPFQLLLFPHYCYPEQCTRITLIVLVWARAELIPLRDVTFQLSLFLVMALSEVSVMFSQVVAWIELN